MVTKVTQGKKAQEKWSDKEKPEGELRVILGSAGFLQVMEMKDRFLKQLLSSKWSEGGVRWKRMWRMVGVSEHKNQSEHHSKHRTRCKVTYGTYNAMLLKVCLCAWCNVSSSVMNTPPHPAITMNIKDQEVERNNTLGHPTTSNKPLD